MSESSAVTENSSVTVGRITQLSDTERRAEIDYRVAARLAMDEDRKSQYMRGFWDCLYIVVIAAWAIYLFYYFREEE